MDTHEEKDYYHCDIRGLRGNSLLLLGFVSLAHSLKTGGLDTLASIECASFACSRYFPLRIECKNIEEKRSKLTCVDLLLIEATIRAWSKCFFWLCHKKGARENSLFKPASFAPRTRKRTFGGGILRNEFILS